uniref:GDT1-like protein 1ic isoform X2 n=1 Tax=Rhizophora mucronata TaxID=61149 RepID=A0A2P2LLY1_RHIMU
MRSLTLSENTLRAHLAAPPCPRPLDQHPHFLLPSVPAFKKRSSKLTCRRPLPIFSKHSRQWSGSPFEEELGGHLLAVSDYWDGLVKSLYYHFPCCFFCYFSMQLL